MWMAPPAATGCVAFMATGSMQDSVLFKDLVIKEVCEKEKSLENLTLRKSFLKSTNQSGFVFKDDFENLALDSSIWNVMKGGELENNKYFQQSGTSAMLFGRDSSIQTRPMDFTNAQHFQFTLGPGKCSQAGKIRVLIGSTTPFQEDIKHNIIQETSKEKEDVIIVVEEDKEGSGDKPEDVHQDVPAKIDGNEDILDNNLVENILYVEDINGLQIPDSANNDKASTAFKKKVIEPEIDSENVEMISIPFVRPYDQAFGRVQDGSGSGSGELPDDINELMQMDQADDPTIISSCSHWKEVDSHNIPAFQEVHTKAIPARFRKKNSCIKWEVINLEEEEEKNSFKTDEDVKGPCWSLDNVAVVTKDAQGGSIVDDFDPIDPTNWLFFPGGQIKEACGSEGNCLSFDGMMGDSWASTRQVDFSDVSYDDDIFLRKDFTLDDNDGWLIRGAGKNGCQENEPVFDFYKTGKREICSPYLDGRSFQVIRIWGGLSTCTRAENATITANVDVNGKKNPLRTFSFKDFSEQITFPLSNKFKKDGIKICLEQEGTWEEWDHAWNIKKLYLLPWMPSHPKYFFQAQMNLKCGYSEAKVDIEASSDGGKSWWSLHQRCLPGKCEGKSSSVTPLVADGIDAGWTMVTLPLPYIALSPTTRFRMKQFENSNTILIPSWGIDYIYIGKCAMGCNGRGLCDAEGKCKCEYGFVGEACETSEVQNPVYISEPFLENIDTSANILEVSGGEISYQCGVIGLGQAAVFKGRGLRFITTVDINTTDAHLLQFHFRAGTVSNVGKCPGPDEDGEGIFVHYSCSGGATWHLLHTLYPKDYKEPSHINIILPVGARNNACRFQIWQDKHSGSGRDMWAIDDLTVTSQQFNTIELTFGDAPEANNSLRFHLGRIGNSCGRNETMHFSESNNNGLVRFLETKSIAVGPSYMMQFDLAIGCKGANLSEDLESTVVLEYSLNHGLTWQLVQRPCTPSTPGCESHFTRGTVYHVSEFYKWKRITLRLPKHTWSPTTRLRLRQLETSDVGLPWSVDNLYIGHHCIGHCSGHGYCTTRGCRCDDEFHGHKCLPTHKLHKEIDSEFSTDDDVDKFDFHVIGGTLAARYEGCGTVVSGSNLYFGAPGVRHFETDDINVEELHSIMFHLVIGGDHGLQSACQSSRKVHSETDEEEVSFGSVVLEYSTDGGLSWELLKEMIRSDFRKPKQFQMIFEEKVLKKAKAESKVIRFRIWQPKHNSEDQWAIDNFKIKSDVETNTLQADFRNDAAISSPWLSVTKHSQKKYCNSDDLAQVMDSKDPVRMAVTNRLALNETDIISFQISVGCKGMPSDAYPVRLEYSRDGGNSWEILQKGCVPMDLNCKSPQEPSIYWPGHHGPWHRVLIPVDHRLSHGNVQIRWIQENPGGIPGGEFSLRDLYIGPACKYSCHGHGMCTAEGLCKCELGYSGKYCGVSNHTNDGWLRDRFESDSLTSSFWEDVDGAVVSTGCNENHHGNMMFFNGDDHRFITTRELDTRNVKYLVFDLQIGADSWESRCRKGISPRDNVMLEYSSDNGLHWILLQEFEPIQTIKKSKSFFISLPPTARTKQTRFRWWQTPPHMLDENEEGKQAEWQVDNVMVMANETLPLNIVEDFSSSLSDKWFIVKGGEIQKGCGRNDPSLIFSGYNSKRYAETWDFKATEATVFQFDIMPGCEIRKIPTKINVEYSTNNGKSWNLIKDDCVPSNYNCSSYDLSSVYSSKSSNNWTRITLTLPKSIEGERTRVRFIQIGNDGDVLDPASSWAIDNVFIGDSCPWMCSGQGYCHKNECVCDEGFFGRFCVPAHVLPCEALDTFDVGQINPTIWTDVQGAEISNRCGTLVSKSALVFFKDGLRYATTIDLDMTSGQFVQFTLHMGCQQSIKRNLGSTKKGKSASEEEGISASILVQFSVNGGITWHVLKNIRFQLQKAAAFISIKLSDFPEARSNATRFRLWQPSRLESLVDVWAIDNLFIGGMPVYPNVLYEDFNADMPTKDAWIDWPAGKIRPSCDGYDGRSAIVIGADEGEHAIYSRDMNVDEQSVVQFDIRVGCSNLTTNNHNVTLEYSTDFGVTWRALRLVKPLYHSGSDYIHELQTPTVYYPNAPRKWTRVIVPMSDISVCGNVRFRWWQGYYHSKETSDEWALDNIYIGPSCQLHCAGHGYCINGDSCDCDENYEEGEYCNNIIANDQELAEDFEAISLPSTFLRWSGAELSTHCEVLNGKQLLFWQQGERMLVTKDLDLFYGSVVQFYLRLQCSEHQIEKEEPILLQYSTDGGITWKLISELSKNSLPLLDLPNTRHFTISLPEKAKTNSTRIRWWQPSVDGVFHSQWAIDQIYIGSTALGLPYFFDSGTGSEWLLRPGSKVEMACGFKILGIHYYNNNGVRFAETPEIITNRKSFIQFEISIGCRETNHCYDVHLEYSIDHGKTWHLTRESCLPSDPDCPEFWSSSVMTSDLYSSLTQVTLDIPERAKSKLTRFRFSQRSAWDSQHSWFVARVFVGDRCPNRCSGRGFCEAKKCICHNGWSGEACDKRVDDLPNFIADDFNVAPSDQLWAKVVGAKVSEICGPIASGPALHFYGGCSRLLETVDIDLRKALFIQFELQTGCLDLVANETANGDNGVLVQLSCNAGVTWKTIQRLPLIYHQPKYVWIELPKQSRCLGGRVRWWQPGSGPRANLLDWALDSVIVGGKSFPPSSVSLVSPDDLKFPLWLRGYNAKPSLYCKFNDTVQVLESTPSEAAIAQTTDIQISVKHSIHFRLALGCKALWDNSIEPVSLEYSRDFGRTWRLVRELCLPFNSTFCTDLHDESVFYAPQEWLYYVFPLANIGPAKYVRFRWIQNATADVMGAHKWAIRDVYIGKSCPYHCLGRGSCINEICKCYEGYRGDHCQVIYIPNEPYIKDTFKGPDFMDHWQHIQGALLAPGCGGELEEPPAATFQGPYSRAIMSRPIDTRSARFVLFTAHIGSSFSRGLCKRADERIHNVYLQYSTDGGIKWNLLRELDHNMYRKPHEDYIVLPRQSMTAATVFRFWQPRLVPSPPAWAIDDVFIGGSEIGASQILESFNGEPTVSEWLFAPHSQTEDNYCQKGDNGSLVWQADHPGHRAITTQELIIHDGHVLQFKISVGCQKATADCYSGPEIRLEFTKEGTIGWDLVRDSCLPETSPDPDCFPYVFHGPSTYTPEVFSSWTRVTMPLPEKTWSSTTQLRWVQDAGRGGQVERILPWALDDIYVGKPCKAHCQGHGDCVEGRCVCDLGYEGESCDPHPSRKGPLPTSLIDGFEGGVGANWATITGGSVGLGCNSLAPYGHGKHLYFSGCGVRQAISLDLDTRRASKVMFVLRIGSHDGTRSCTVDLTDTRRAGNKGVVFQFSADNGISWSTIDIHNPLDFRKARRVAYSLPEEARQNGVQLRWWQPDHDGLGTDQWAIDNVEIVLAQRKATNQYESHVFQQTDL